jgi:hypothetical protein
MTVSLPYQVGSDQSEGQRKEAGTVDLPSNYQPGVQRGFSVFPQEKGLDFIHSLATHSMQYIHTHTRTRTHARAGRETQTPANRPTLLRPLENIWFPLWKSQAEPNSYLGLQTATAPCPPLGDLQPVHRHPPVFMLIIILSPCSVYFVTLTSPREASFSHKPNMK